MIIHRDRPEFKLERKLKKPCVKSTCPCCWPAASTPRSSSFKHRRINYQDSKTVRTWEILYLSPTCSPMVYNPMSRHCRRRGYRIVGSRRLVKPIATYIIPISNSGNVYIVGIIFIPVLMAHGCKPVSSIVRYSKQSLRSTRRIGGSIPDTCNHRTRIRCRDRPRTKRENCAVSRVRLQRFPWRTKHREMEGEKRVVKKHLIVIVDSISDVIQVWVLIVCPSPTGL
jgi:hypothetical protein